MLQKDPTLVITMVQHNLVVAQMEAELQTCTYDTQRLRIIGVGEKDISFGPTALQKALAQMCDGWTPIITKLSQEGEGWPKPRAIHLDFACGGFVIETTKQIIDPECKTLVWFSAGLVSMPAHFTDYDFAAIAQEIYSDNARRQGRSLDEILEQVALAWNGTDKLSGIIVKSPGAPDMYDHERLAFAAGVPDGIAVILKSAQKLAKLVNGYIAATGVCFEPVAVPHCKEFYKERGQELFTVGMQAHELCWTDNASVSPTNEVVRSFLDKAVSEHGPKSALYISFGSLFFPVAILELVEALVNTLLSLEQPFPFIFALGGKLAALPKDLIERVNSSGKGYVCDFWVEQRAILQHGAIGWFLTHGGYNSTSEALSQGIPLIVWPTMAEQPLNAALLSSGPNPVAIELMQIRTGRQRGTSLRGGPKITGTVEDASAEFAAAFADARGPKGAVLAANAMKMARALRGAHGGGGGRDCSAGEVLETGGK
ncbi:hypothetical protein FB451DRAFT_1394803 [Mycena latifolia]|nr:hypothetical protein FB451DRAFT_1394803 [Mycena latifolia]